MPRLFFALQPTRAQADALVAECAPLIGELAGQSMPGANVHATLSFIGEVPENRVDALCAAASLVRFGPVSLTFDALEVWEKPQILCATAAATEAGRDLSLALAAAATSAGLSPDLKPFRPHLTIARKVRRQAARGFSQPRAIRPLELRADHFVLMESRRTEAGSTYSVVRSWPLDKK